MCRIALGCPAGVHRWLGQPGQPGLPWVAHEARTLPLTTPGSSPEDQYNHGFVYVFSRAAWEQQPFPDVETVGTKDSDFMKALRSQGAPVVLLDLGTQEPLAACGWHRDATCGAKDAPANINDAQVLDFFRFRGDDSRTPQAFGDMLQLVSEIAATLHARRDRYLRDLVAEHGSVHVCAYCNFAVALASNAKGQEKQISTSMQVRLRLGLSL